MTKSSSSSTNLAQPTALSSQRSSKRSLSPSILIALERSPQKRRRARNSKQKLLSSAATVKIASDDDEPDDEDIEQENDDDDDIVSIDIEQPKRTRQAKQRQASSGSIEYVQTLSTDQQNTSSLNNIENIKSKAKINDEEIIICRSPPSVSKASPSRSKTHSKASINGNTTRKSSSQQVTCSATTSPAHPIALETRMIKTDDLPCSRHPIRTNMFEFDVKSAVKFSRAEVGFPSM